MFSNKKTIALENQIEAHEREIRLLQKKNLELSEKLNQYDTEPEIIAAISRAAKLGIKIDFSFNVYGWFARTTDDQNPERFNQKIIAETTGVSPHRAIVMVVQQAIEEMRRNAERQLRELDK